jgi:hypothetical protein
MGEGLIHEEAAPSYQRETRFTYHRIDKSGPVSGVEIAIRRGPEKNSEDHTLEQFCYHIVEGNEHCSESIRKFASSCNPDVYGNSFFRGTF